MVRFIKSKVNRKLTAMCILLAFLICIASCLSGFFLYRNSIYKTCNEFAYQIGNIALSCVNKDRITEYLRPEYYDEDTGEFIPDDEYMNMATSIYQIYVNTTMHTYKSGIYICVPEKTDDGQYLLTNIFDVRIVEAADDVRKYYSPGVVDPMGVKNPEEVMRIFKEGVRSTDYFVHESSFGYNSTAILPVTNSSGETVALLMADMPMLYVSQTLTAFLLSTIVITVAIVVLFICAFIELVKRRITHPIELISKEASSFTESDIQISDRLAEITQIDEIGELAKNVRKMEQDIGEYIENLTRVTAEKERIGAELDVARNIQANMLPNIFPPFPERKDMDIYATMTPAKEVGGDFYDFFLVDKNHMAIVMADVSGKGVPAALFMVIAKTLIKNRTMMGGTPAEIFEYVNNQLCESNEAGMFVTAWLTIIDLKTGKAISANAGHEYPAVRRKDGAYDLVIAKHSPALACMEDMKYRNIEYELYEGDSLFVYTDGVTEATDSGLKLFGNDRLVKALNIRPDAAPDELIPIVRNEIDKFVNGADQFDDITMLSFRYNGDIH